jgi:hypothetical protein
MSDTFEQEERPGRPPPVPATPVAGPAAAATERHAVASRAGNAALARAREADAGARTTGDSRPQGAETDARAAKELAAPAYLEVFAFEIQADLELAMMDVDVSLPTTFARWRGSFVSEAMGPIYAAPAEGLWTVLEGALSPRGLLELVNRGRDADEWGIGLRAYNAGVAHELRAVFPEALAASLTRVLPAYLAARNQALMAEEERTQMSLAEPPEPAPATIVPKHPLDRHVIAALCTGVVRFSDVLGYRTATPQERSAHSLRGVRDVSFTWEARRGLWTWIHVTAPADAAPSDVAQTLYGDAALACEILGGGGLFGFQPLKLRPDQAASWREAVTAESTPASNAWQGLPIDLAERKRSVGGGSVWVIDPLDELKNGEVRDEAALQQAGAASASTADSAATVQEMRRSAQLLDDAIADAAVFGMAVRLAPARAALEQRSLAVYRAADSSDASKWGAQAQEQRQILQHATEGIKCAAQQWRAFQLPAGQDPHILPMHTIGPLHAVADAYVKAAAHADLVVTARELLARAEQLSKTYPIDMLEQVLAALRPSLAEAATDKTGLGIGGPGYGVPSLKVREAAIRAELMEARDLLRADPARFAELLRRIHREVNDLQDEVAVVANLDTIDAIWREMHDHLSMIGVVTGKNDDYAEQMTVLNQWRTRWEVCGALLASGIPEGRTRLQELRRDAPAFHEVLKRSAALFEKRERRERYVKLGLKLAALIGIGLITMGIGELVGGGLVLGLGWGEAAFATTAAVAGAEALTFTTLSTVILQENTSVGGFFLDLVKNWATFGALKGLSIGYEALVGAQAARTLGGKATLILAQFEAMTAASLAEAALVKRAKGEELTKAEATEIVMQSAAVMIGTVVAARCGRSFLKGLRLRGAATFRARFRAVDGARADALAAAQALQLSKRIDKAGEVVAKDAEAIKAEQTLLEALARAAGKHELAPEELAEIAALQAQNATVLAGNRRTAVMLRLEAVGPGRFYAKPGQLGAATKEFAELGDTVSEPALDAVTGAPSVRVTPKDGGGAFHVTEKLAPGASAPPARRPFVLFRGTTYSFRGGRSTFTHDLGPGVYMTPDLELGVRYAQERRSQVQAQEPGAPGIVVRVETTMDQLGKVLDVTEPGLRAEWEAYLRKMPLGDVVLAGGGAAEIYNAHFHNWLLSKGMSASQFDVIIGWEYRNNGPQVCIRNGALADSLLKASQEYARAHEPVTPAYPEGTPPSGPAAPPSAADVVKTLERAGLTKTQIRGLTGGSRSRARARAVDRLARHFTAADLAVLGEYLAERKVLLSDDAVEHLIDGIAPGEMAAWVKKARIAEVHGEATRGAATEKSLSEQQDPSARASVTDKPTPGREPRAFVRGNFAHRFAEYLMDVGRLPRPSQAEVVVELRDGTGDFIRLDRIISEAHIGLLFEIKPAGRSAEIGRAQLRAREAALQREFPKRDGWRGEVVEYTRADVEGWLGREADAARAQGNAPPDVAGIMEVFGF